MSDFSLFDISAGGMAVERLRMQIGSINLANANTTRTQNGELYKPLSVISSPKYTLNFADYLTGVEQSNGMPAGVKVDAIEERDVPPRVVHEPSHPDADANGYVKYPNINPVTEMVNLINITRSYEANVRAFNATKKMFQVAMDIGSK